MIDFTMELKRMEVEGAEKWREYAKNAPAFQFRPEWKVKILPPFAGAMVRFAVSYKDKSVSVYFDPFGRLGAMSMPYWEIYPYEDDIKRYFCGEEDEMMKDIESVLGKETTPAPSMVYDVVHGYDVDGGFGDAVYKTRTIMTFSSKEIAEAFVKKFSKPHCYAVPYSHLYCGELDIEEREVTADIDLESIDTKNYWWLTSEPVECDEDDEDEYEDEDDIA